MQIPVTKDKDNQTELILLDMHEVLYIHVVDRTIAYHTLGGEFYHLFPSLSSLSIHLEQHGFRKLDRINLVNIHKITHFDNEHRKIYFEKEISKDSKFATVSFLTKKKLQKEIDQWIDKNLNNTI
jgi:DNA-binding LytR/AlgR family response regulator